MQIFNNENIYLYNLDSLELYNSWPSPTVIISDGPYGVKGFPGDPNTPTELPGWYEPHIKKWSEMSTPQTTLWFWNTEIGWATVHPILEKYGWEYKACNTWNKGLSHVAGNVNSKTLSKLPTVTEVCVQYVKKPEFKYNDEKISMKEWLRLEWLRTGLPFNKTNEACGVANAATRKYFTKCHLWYMPPSDAFEKIANYANTYGKDEGKPYFTVDGVNPLTSEDWDKYSPKFYCPIGVTNVWDTPQLNGQERLKKGTKALHLNQKPLVLIERIITMSSDKHDIVWNPFGGTFTSAIASINLNRKCYSSEINTDAYEIGINRVNIKLNEPQQITL